MVAISSSALAQSTKKGASRQDASVASAVLSGAGKVGIVVVGSAAKIAWGTTKFVLKDVAVPVVVGLAKPVVTKMAPAMTKFAIKNSAKYLLPIALKLSVP